MARRRRLPDLSRSGGFVGMAGLACVLFLDLAAFGFLAWWAVLVLLVVWLALVAVGARWFQRRPVGVVALPVLGVLAWVAAVLLAAR